MNYKGMVSLISKFAGQPFKILAFPCNDFLNQEPHSNSDVQKFAAGYNFTGDMFAKTNVPTSLTSGSCDASDGCKPESTSCCPANTPLWQFLASASSVPKNGKIPWNFEKYLVNKQGVPVSRTAAEADPSSADSVSAIEALLKA